MLCLNLVQNFEVEDLGTADILNKTHQLMDNRIE